MYESFYHFELSPFRLTPDSRFFFESMTHQRGLAYIRYALLQREGFVVVSGGPGTGKTELMYKLVDELPKKSIRYAKIIDSNLRSEDLLSYIAASFDLEIESRSKGELLKDLEDFALQQAQLGRSILLLVDDAHYFSSESLAELAMLSNWQMAGKPIIQCILLGHKSIWEKISHPDLLYLKQRIVASAHLENLARQEVRKYVEFRLLRAGWRGDPKIRKGIFDLVYTFSGGVPRQINYLFNRVLICAYTQNAHVIDLKLLEDAIKEIRDETNIVNIPLDTDSNPPTPEKNMLSIRRKVTGPKRNQVSASFSRSRPFKQSTLVKSPPPTTNTNGSHALSSPKQEYHYHFASLNDEIHDELIQHLGSMDLEKGVLRPIINKTLLKGNSQPVPIPVHVDIPHSEVAEAGYFNHSSLANAQYSTFTGENIPLGSFGQKLPDAEIRHVERNTESPEHRNTELHLEPAMATLADKGNSVKAKSWSSYVLFALVILGVFTGILEITRIQVPRQEAGNKLTVDSNSVEPAVNKRSVLKQVGSSQEKLVRRQSKIAATGKGDTNQAQTHFERDLVVAAPAPPQTAMKDLQITTKTQPPPSILFAQPSLATGQPNSKAESKTDVAESTATRITSDAEATNKLVEKPDMAGDNQAKIEPEPAPKSTDQKVEKEIVGEKVEKIEQNNPTSLARAPVTPAKPDVLQKPKQDVALSVTGPLGGKGNAVLNSAKPARSLLGNPLLQDKYTPALETGKLYQLLDKLTLAYERGDLHSFLGLFSEDINSNGVSNRKQLENDYKKLFNITDMRKMVINDVAWTKQTNGAQGEGKFFALVREKGDTTTKLFRGRLSIDVDQRQDGDLITQLNYDYEE